MKYIILFFILLAIPFVYGQKDRITLPEYEFIDSNYWYSLEYVAKMDTNCAFYSDSVCYFVSVSDTILTDGVYFVVAFESRKGIDMCLSTSDGLLLGYIKYKNNYFFIFENTAKHAFDGLFKLTDKNKTFSINKFYELSEDDSWPIRIMGYQNGTIYYLGSRNHEYRCKCKDN